ncbi:ATP-binding cassette domain-containing protein [Salinithrix halophila]|uniref:ATP-binding cassette domain-containing protein n=1 Tax=Salinithrix halophila TaxID=1485204 RepID=A0ABV8JDL0_9BACL
MSNDLPLVYANQLRKSFGNKIVLRDLHFELHEGTTAVLFGKNGVGKSVFLNCILGFLQADQGEVRIDGHPLTDRIHIRNTSAFISSDHQDFLNLFTPREYFSFVQEIYQLPKEEATALIQQWSDDLQVSREMDSLFSGLSFGTKKKIQLIGALLFRPKLLVCDEIFEGLDSDAVNYVIAVFDRRQREGQSSLFTTHIAQYAMKTTSKRYVLEDGQIRDFDWG